MRWWTVVATVALSIAVIVPPAWADERKTSFTARHATTCGDRGDECDGICRHAFLDRRMTDGKWIANCLAVCLSVDDGCGPDAPDFDRERVTLPSSIEATKSSPSTSRVRVSVDPVQD